MPLESVHLFVCVGLNYRKHAEEAEVLTTYSTHLHPSADQTPAVYPLAQEMWWRLRSMLLVA
jgi:2-keto-4-pentenoate hydratase/2-oxohepta-3-ene-1,7-dioic acid hydratase in catechol pathway